MQLCVLLKTREKSQEIMEDLFGFLDVHDVPFVAKVCTIHLGRNIKAPEI
jgi:hypothetical protein